MPTPARIAKHPIHPMLIVFPIGLLVFSFICDIFFLTGGSSNWSTVAYYCMGGGIVGGLLAAVPGMIDLFSMHRSRAKTIGLWHMCINLAGVVLFVANFYMRMGAGETTSSAFVLSLVGVLGLLVSGWLGGEMVYVHHVGTTTTQTGEQMQGMPHPVA